MKPNLKNHFFPALFIAIFLFACNGNDKKAEETKATDNAVITPAENTTPATAEEKIDPIATSSNFYKVLADSLGIRILEATYKPGDLSTMHSHPVNAIYVIQGGTAEFKLKDGTKMTNEFKTEMSAIRGYDMHSVKNTGKTTLKVLLVEVNRPANIVMPDAAMDACKVAPENYKLLHDSLGIRIIEVNYKPGQSSAFHSHPDLAAYVITGTTAELTDKEGNKNVTEMKSGMAWVNGPATHKGKNLGKNAFKMMLFEINRPRN
jgi:quercetin dioxygenase-like cupin family protein